MMYNGREITLTLSRDELYELMLSSMYCYDKTGVEKWDELSDKLKDIIYEYDCSNSIE